MGSAYEQNGFGERLRKLARIQTYREVIVFVQSERGDHHHHQ